MNRSARAIVVITLIVFGAIAALNYQSLILIAGILMERDPGPPPIANGVITDKDWLHFDNASRKFTVTLQRQFPLGTPEKALTSALLSQQFQVAPPAAPNCGKEVRTAEGIVASACPSWDPKKTLEYHWGRFPCGENISVFWSSDREGRITSIQGEYWGVCV